MYHKKVSIDLYRSVYKFSISDCLLSVLIVSLFIINAFLITRVRHLENEIEHIKRNLYKTTFLDDSLLSEIIGFEDDELYEDKPTEEEPKYIDDNIYNEGDHQRSALEDKKERVKRNILNESTAQSASNRNKKLHKKSKRRLKKSVKTLTKFKSSGSFESLDEDDTNFTVVGDPSFGRHKRRQKHSNLEILDETHPRVGRIKPLPSVHFSGDTSKYILGRHENFNGNGHLRHLQRTFIDWKPSEWVSSSGLDSYFRIKEGLLTVRDSGLYFIYSQIYYLDEHDTIGYTVYKNDEIILQCTITAHTMERRRKGNTCYTAGVEYLTEGDKISIADVSEGRYSLFEVGKSFFGVIKLGDMKIQ